MKKKIFISIIVVLLVLIIGFYTLTKPSHNREWADDLRILPSIEINGSNIKINNVRNWRYNSDSVEENWFNENYDLEKIKGAWFLVEPFAKWDGVAHTMISFDFEDGKSVIISVEARREKGEKYDSWLGLFRRYELIYNWGTEADFVSRRVINQEHDLYMYPLDIDIDYAKKLFLDLAETTNSIYEKPRFYNTLTQNCTNVFAYSANRAEPGTAPWHISRILPGYSEEFLYKEEYIKADGDLDSIREKYYINDIVRKIDRENYNMFSKILREGIFKQSSF